MSDSCDPMDCVACWVPLSVEFSRQEYWNGCHFLLQGIFLTQGSNLGLLHCRQITIWATRETPRSEGRINQTWEGLNMDGSRDGGTQGLRCLWVYLCFLSPLLQNIFLIEDWLLLCTAEIKASDVSWPLVFYGLYHWGGGVFPPMFCIRHFRWEFWWNHCGSDAYHWTNQQGLRGLVT